MREREQEGEEREGVVQAARGGRERGKKVREREGRQEGRQEGRDSPCSLIRGQNID